MLLYSKYNHRLKIGLYCLIAFSRYLIWCLSTYVCACVCACGRKIGMKSCAVFIQIVN